MNNFYTLSYSETSKGWPSFFSYGAEQMVGINNYFYSFKGGNLYRHNSSAVNRGTFYNVQSASSIKTVFNESPLEAKLFKTIELESSPSAWTVAALAESPVADFDVTDPQFNAATDTAIVNQGVASIAGTEFEMKEGAWYAYLRNSNTAANSNFPTNQYGLRSIKGIGTPLPTGVVDANTNACTMEFPADNPVSPSLSIGDFLYQNETIIGEVTGINRATNVVTIDNDTAVHTNLTIAVDNLFTFYVQNASAESHGLLGHYLDVTLTLTANVAVELFAVKSDIMKSYP